MVMAAMVVKSVLVFMCFGEQVRFMKCEEI